MSDTETARKIVTLEVPAYMALEIVAALIYRLNVEKLKQDYIDLHNQVGAQLTREEAEKAEHYVQQTMRI